MNDTLAADSYIIRQEKEPLFLVLELNWLNFRILQSKAKVKVL